MCYCGNFATDGFFNCCQERMTEKQEAKMKKEWERQVSKGYFECNKKTFVESAIEGAKTIMEKGEKIKVAPAYMPEKFIKAWEELGGNIAKLEVPANETPREELLLKDVGVLFEENRRLRAENEKLKADNEILDKQNRIIFNTLRANAQILDGLEKQNNANV